MRLIQEAIEDLREQYLDPRALEAGAADSKWYSFR